MTPGPQPCYNKRVSGEVSEGFKEPVLKTGDAVMHRGFESHPLRHRFDCAKAERLSIRSAFLYKRIFADEKQAGGSRSANGDRAVVEPPGEIARRDGAFRGRVDRMKEYHGKY